MFEIFIYGICLALIIYIAINYIPYCVENIFSLESFEQKNKDQLTSAWIDYINILAETKRTKNINAHDYGTVIGAILESIKPYYTSNEYNTIYTKFADAYLAQLKFISTGSEVDLMQSNNLLRIAHSILAQHLQGSDYTIMLFEEYIVQLVKYLKSPGNDEYPALIESVKKVTKELIDNYKIISENTVNPFDVEYSGNYNLEQLTNTLLNNYTELTKAYIALKDAKDNGVSTVYAKNVQILNTIYQYTGNTGDAGNVGTLGTFEKIRIINEINKDICKIYYSANLNEHIGNECQTYDKYGKYLLPSIEKNKALFSEVFIERYNAYAWYVKKLAQSYVNNPGAFACYVKLAKIQSSLVAASVVSLIAG